MIRRLLAYLREHLEYPLPGYLVGGVDHHPQEGDHVLDVGLLEEAEAAPDLEGYVPPGQLHLQFHAVVMGAVEDGYLAQGYTFVSQLQDPLGHEFRLLDHVPQGGDDRHDPARLDGLQVLLELPGIVGDGMVGEIEDLRGAPVVRLEPVDPGLGIALRELEDILEIGAPEGVDALGVISDDGDVPVDEAHEVDDLGLYPVGVLVLVDENVGKDGGVVLSAGLSSSPRILCQKWRRSSKSMALAALFFSV